MTQSWLWNSQIIVKKIHEVSLNKSEVFLKLKSLIKKQKVKMLKRRLSMDIDDVRNDINAWLVDEDDDSMENDFSELVGDHTKEDIIEDERDVSEGC